MQCIHAVSSLGIQRMPLLHCCNDRRPLLLPPVLEKPYACLPDLSEVQILTTFEQLEIYEIACALTALGG